MSAVLRLSVTAPPLPPLGAHHSWHIPSVPGLPNRLRADGGSVPRLLRFLRKPPFTTSKAMVASLQPSGKQTGMSQTALLSFPLFACSTIMA